MPTSNTFGPEIIDDVETLADTLIERLEKRLIVGLPLGLGKANHLINTLFRRACEDSSIDLTIFTALTLEAPTAGSDLQQRFLGPVSERLFDDYPALDYAKALRRGDLPPNITVRDFYFQAGTWLGSPLAQQIYTSINYTQALDALLRAGVNLILQLIAPPGADNAGRYSLSCNPDISADLLDRRRAGQLELISVGQINSRLPFLGGEADRPESDFDYLLKGSEYEFPLFSPPHKPVSNTDYAIGLQVASLVPDGGTLQIGIGSIGDAITQGLLLRQQRNDEYRQLLKPLLKAHDPAQLVQWDRFEQGLYGVTEMLVEGFLALIKADIIRRRVGGALVHSAFYVGSPVFYQLLEELPPASRAGIATMPVSFTNELYDSTPLRPDDSMLGLEAEKRSARTGARFINSAMMVTLTGAVISDGLDDGRVVSGVGGQYNFVAQAFALPDARAVITLPATRTKAGKTQSNIVWQYDHTTLPRHLRDIVVTEYGIADLRDKSDADVIAELLKIADSRFQPELLQKAKAAGKLPQNYKIPPAWRDNTPGRIRSSLEHSVREKLLPAFPLGSGLTETEEDLAQALSKLAPQVGSWPRLLRLALTGLRRPASDSMKAGLERMGLSRPRSAKEHFYRALLKATLNTE
ncbi:acetyl-CoA hydrolase/transferase C-terminal domain-containing protein [Marinimicrobium agarilyticum]|uniref:acetyl-CoA hydrolase/transferase C-terminal domain-containing protein n=1 Tax=Marinimicrobium agarilyticum TaxID=306546 RepID=UPI0004106945|nr:acetyl-CoA hydrolase/transferase C-terminal domain-containing protein [Marinimicrobium agarilyticum]